MGMRKGLYVKRNAYTQITGAGNVRRNAREGLKRNTGSVSLPVLRIMIELLC